MCVWRVCVRCVRVCVCGPVLRVCVCVFASVHRSVFERRGWFPTAVWIVEVLALH